MGRNGPARLVFGGTGLATVNTQVSDYCAPFIYSPIVSFLASSHPSFQHKARNDISTRLKLRVALPIVGELVVFSLRIELPSYLAS